MLKNIYILYCLSGFVSLGYQIVWFRIFIDKYGATNLTFGLVLTNFILGLGLGSLASQRLTAYIGKDTNFFAKLKYYGVIEIIVAGCVLFTITTLNILPETLLNPVYQFDGFLFRHSWGYQSLQLLNAAICILLPCFFMGLTFPLLCYIFIDHVRFPSSLYAWNTLGACSGILACEFLLLPNLGHQKTLWLMIIINFFIGLFFIIAKHFRITENEKDNSQKRSLDIKPQKKYYPLSVVLICAIISGFLTGAFEADAFQRLRFLGCRNAAAMSFISFWAILGIFLSSWTVQFVHRFRLGWIKVAYLIAWIIYFLLWEFAYPLRDLIVKQDMAEALEALQTKAPPGFGSADFAYFTTNLDTLLLFSAIYIFPVFFLLSFLLPYICNSIQSTRKHVGLVYGFNTLSFCAGMLGFAWLAPYINIFYSLKLFLWFFLILVIFFLSIQIKSKLPLWKPVFAVIGIIVACFMVPTNFDSGMFPQTAGPAKYPVRALMSNGAHTTFIVEKPEGDTLYFDSHPMTGTAKYAQRYMRLMAHFPLMTMKNPQKALLICFGVGNTASAIAAHHDIEQIDIVDLNEKVFLTAPELKKINNNVIEDKRVKLILDDGRTFLKHSDQKYDLITSEPPPPMHNGIYRLYSKEYYEAAAAHLTPEGIMTQWLPIYQMPQEAVAMSINTFLQAFPHCLLFVGTNEEFIILGSHQQFDLSQIEKKFDSNKEVIHDLNRIDIFEPIDLLSRIIKTDRELRDEYGYSSIISDQNNDLSYLMKDLYHPPVITYDPENVLNTLTPISINLLSDLKYTMLHLGRLKTRIRDFPVSSLATVKEKNQNIELAGADWYAIGFIWSDAQRAYGQKQWIKSLDYIEKIFNYSNQLPYVWEKHAILMFKTGQYKKALESWLNYQKIEPKTAKGYKQAGIVLIHLKSYAKAYWQLKKALQLNPNDQVTQYLLSQFYIENGKD